MVKYFLYPRSNNWVNCPYPHETEKQINQYAEKNNLEVICVSCDRDNGIFVVLKKNRDFIGRVNI